MQPPRAQAGDEAARIDPYLAIADQLNKQLSLSEGLAQQRQNQYSNVRNYTQGAGQQSVQVLADPSNRAEGESPVQGLTAAVNLNDAFGAQLDRSLQESESAQTNVLQTLTTLLNLQKSKEDRDLAKNADRRAEEQLKLDKRKQDLEEKKLTATGVTVDDLLTTRKSLLENGLDTSAVDTALKEKGIDTSSTSRSKATEDLARTIDELLALDTREITGRIRQGGTFLGSDQGRKAKVLYDNIVAKLSLDNVEKLKGQGAISDAERRLLADAATKINNIQSDTDFRAALEQTKQAIQGETTGGIPNAVRMKSPDGFVYDVPQSEVNSALENGYKRL